MSSTSLKTARLRQKFLLLDLVVLDNLGRCPRNCPGILFLHSLFIYSVSHFVPRHSIYGRFCQQRLHIRVGGLGQRAHIMFIMSSIFCFLGGVDAALRASGYVSVVRKRLYLLSLGICQCLMCHVLMNAHLW